MSLKDLVPKSLTKKLSPARRSEEDDAFSRLHREMNRMFDEFSQGWGLSSRFWRTPFDMLEGGRAGAWLPTVDVSETEREVKVTAELPGMDEKDVQVGLSNGLLTLSGEKKTEREGKDGSVHRSERTYGSFHRTLALPAEVNPDKVEAVFRKGVLTVTLPKTASAQSRVRRVDVKAG